MWPDGFHATKYVDKTGNEHPFGSSRPTSEKRITALRIAGSTTDACTLTNGLFSAINVDSKAIVADVPW